VESGSLGKEWMFIAGTINELLSQSDIRPQSLSRSASRPGIARCRSDVDGALRLNSRTSAAKTVAPATLILLCSSGSGLSIIVRNEDLPAAAFWFANDLSVPAPISALARRAVLPDGMGADDVGRKAGARTPDYPRIASHSRCAGRTATCRGNRDAIEAVPRICGASTYSSTTGANHVGA
jgi:hypothetical protein